MPFTVIPARAAPETMSLQPSAAAKALSKETKLKTLLQEENSSLKNHVAILMETVHDLSRDKTELLQEATQTQQLLSQLNQTVARQKTQMTVLCPVELQRTNSHLERVRNKLTRCRAQLRTAKGLQSRFALRTAKLNRLKKTSTAEKQTLENRITTCRAKIGRLEADNQALTKELASIQEQEKDTLRGEKNRFSDNVRKTVMQLQGDGNVPAGKCSKVIQIIAENLFKTTFDDKDLPCLQTAVNIADEGHVLAKIQATEQMLTAANYTLHADGTGRNGQKIVAHQISLDNGSTLSLGFTTVATENADTLLDVTVQLLRELTDVYCTDDADKEETFKALLSKMTSLMSDRAAVMKSYDSKIKEFIESELGHEVSVHFLHCNAHFLLGLSRSCETAMKHVEAEVKAELQQQLGRDNDPRFKRYHSSEPATARLIRTLSSITGPRGDEKNGCRAEWIGYCGQEKKTSRMTSYRSNRFNSYFEGAAATVYHHVDLRKFFGDGFLGHSNLKIESTAADINDDNLLSLVCAVAILYIKVTGPFWNLLESDTKYTEFHVYVQRMETCFDRWRADASQLLDQHFPGIFNGEFAMETEMAAAIYQFASLHLAQVRSALELMMRDILLVTRKQLSDFLPPEGKYAQQLPPDVQTQLDHCPLTNLMGEYVFGEMDFDMGKKRHTTFHHRSSTQMLHHNKTSKWLSEKNEEDARQLLKTARKKGRWLREQHKLQEVIVRQKIREKLLENERQKLLKAAEVARKRALLIQKVMEHGGPFKYKGDVDLLVQRLRGKTKIKEALKDEIRFQKVVIGRKGDLKLSGTIEQLKQVLRAHLDEQPVEADVPDETPENDEPDQPPHAVEPGELSDTDQQEEPTQADAYNESSDDNMTPPKKRPRLHREHPSPFIFTKQAQWVAVFYDQQFYIGQVLAVHSDTSATIQYLEKTKGRSDYFRWPTVDDVAKTDSRFVFRWDFDVKPVSSNFRMWKVDCIDDISDGYQRIQIAA